MKRYMQEKGDSYPWRTGGKYLPYNDPGYGYGALLFVFVKKMAATPEEYPRKAGTVTKKPLGLKEK